MKILKIQNEKTAKKLEQRLLKRKKIVGYVSNEEELKKIQNKKIDVVIMCKSN